MIHCLNVVAIEIGRTMEKSEKKYLKLTKKKSASVNSIRRTDDKEESGEDVGNMRSVYAVSGDYDNTGSYQQNKNPNSKMDFNGIAKARSAPHVFRGSKTSREISLDFSVEATDAEAEEKKERKLREIFDYIDADGTGTLSVTELMTGAQCYGLDPREEDLKTFISDSDINNDGTLNYDEFKDAMIKIKESMGDPEQLLNEALDEFMTSCDKDGDNRISKAELREYLKSKGEAPLTDEELDEMFNEMNADGDEYIDKNEIIQTLRSNSE